MLKPEMLASFNYCGHVHIVFVLFLLIGFSPLLHHAWKPWTIQITSRGERSEDPSDRAPRL